MQLVRNMALGFTLSPKLRDDLLPDARCFALDSSRLTRAEPASAKLNADRFVLPLTKKSERMKPIGHCHRRDAPPLLSFDYRIDGNEPRHSCPYIIRGHQ